MTTAVFAALACANAVLVLAMLRDRRDGMAAISGALAGLCAAQAAGMWP